MAKKWIPIIAVIVAIVAIIVIAVIGSNPSSRNKTVYVTNINVTTPHTGIYNDESRGDVKYFMLNDDNTTLVDGKSTFDIDYEVVPTNATYKEVTFTSSDTDVATVDEDGVVTFLSNNAVFITLTSQDEREISTTVQLVWEPATSSEFSITLGDNDEVTYQSLDDTQLFSVEGDTLYLYEGMSYVMNSDAVIETTENAYSTFENGVLTTTAKGSFTFTLTFDGKEPITQNVEVVEYINTFARGTSYTSYQSTKDNIGQTNYLNKDVENYQVGVDSPYHFDIVIQNDELETVSLADANLEYTVYDITDGETLIKDNTQVFTVNADGSLSFVKTNVGKTYRVVVEPKYNFLNRNALTFEFELTNGVNAFTHYDLKEYFADLDVNNIVIHSNISVIVESNQLDPSGRLVNFANVSDNNGVTGDIYTRRYTSSDIGNGNLDINLIGNYFTIDATNMPYLSVTDGYTFDILEWTDASGYPCASIQTAIFKVQDASGDAYDTGIEKEEDEIVNFNVKNLRLTGNTSTGIIYETDEGGEPIIEDDEAQVIANQGSSSAGFMGRGAVVVSTDNVVITNTNIGIYVTGSFGGIDTNNTYIFDSWANGVFGWRTTSMSLENTTIRQAGGAAICVTDATITDQYAPEWMDVTFNFGPNVIVDNYVTGAEGYFIVNNLSTVVPTLKGQLDSSLQSLLGKTVLKDVVTDEGTESTFNFVIQFGREKNNYAYKDKNIGNIGSEDGWETYIGGMWLVKEGNYLLNKNNPSEKWEITGTTTTITKTTDSQFIMNIYNDSTEEYERIERRSGYYTSLPTGASVNGAYVTGISEITNADDAYLMAGVAGGYMQDDNFAADITGLGTASGQVATLLNGEVTLIESLQQFKEALIESYPNLASMIESINTDLTATKQVIYNKIAALGDGDIQAGLQAFSTALSDDMQKIVYLCDATLLNNIKTNIETFNTVLELLNQFGDAIPTFTSGQVTSEQIEQLKAGITGVVNGYAQVLAGAKLQPSLALIPTALTLSNNQLGFTDGTENVNLIEAKINNDLLGDFSGIYICAGIYDVAA